MRRVIFFLVRCARIGLALLSASGWAPQSAKAESFSWYDTSNGSFTDPQRWLVLPGTLFPEKNPNPEGKLPGANDSVGFTRGTIAPGSYEVSILGGSVNQFSATGFTLPALTQPLTFRMSGTFSANIVELSDLIVITGGGELVGGAGSTITGAEILGGTQLTLRGGTLQNVTLDQSEAHLMDGTIATAFQLPLEGLTLVKSTLTTGGRIDFTGSAAANLTDGSRWKHEGDAITGGNLRLKLGSQFETTTDTAFAVLHVQDGSRFMARTLTNLLGGLSLSGGSSLDVGDASISGGSEFLPVEIGGGSSFKSLGFSFGQGWVRVSGGSKLQNSTADMGSLGGATLVVTDPSSEWVVTNRNDGLNVRVLNGGTATLGMPETILIGSTPTTFATAATHLSARVDGKDSQLKFDFALGANRIQVLSGGAALGNKLVLIDGVGGVTGKDSRLILSGDCELGTGGFSRFDIAEGGRMQSANGLIASEDKGEASVTISGAESLWRIHGGLTLGKEGSAKASLNINQGGNLTVGPEILRGNESVRIGGGSTVIVSDPQSAFETRFTQETLLGLEPGAKRGVANVRVLGGARLTANKLSLAPDPTGEAIVSVLGAGSSLSVTEELLLGGRGKGTLRLTDGAKGSARKLWVGESSQDNSALISGSDTVLNVKEVVYAGLGSGDVGTITIAARGQLILEGLPGYPHVIFGYGKDSKGTLVVDGGAAATMEAGQSSFVDFGVSEVVFGFEGASVFTISGGGSAQMQNCYLGYFGSSSAIALVTGQTGNGYKSNLKVAKELVVGGVPARAPATLDINSGGSINVGQTVRIRPTGTVRLEEGAVIVGFGKGSSRDFVLGAGGTLILEPGGHLNTGPLGKLVFDGGTATTRPPGASGVAPSHRLGNHALEADPTPATIEGDVSMEGGGTMTVQLSGLSTGAALRVTGSATLGGKLRIEFMDGFAPRTSDTFKLFDFGSVTGNFAEVEIVGVAPGFQYDLTADAASDYTLGAINDGVAISSPRLSIVRNANQLTITWPATAAGYQLQSASSLNGANWQTRATVPPFLVPQTLQSEFFRLIPLPLDGPQ